MFFFQPKNKSLGCILHWATPHQPCTNAFGRWKFTLGWQKGAIKGQCYQKIRLLANCCVLQMISRFFHASLTFCEGVFYDTSYKFTHFDRDSRRFNKLLTALVNLKADSSFTNLLFTPAMAYIVLKKGNLSISWAAKSSKLELAIFPCKAQHFCEGLFYAGFWTICHRD